MKSEDQANEQADDEEKPCDNGHDGQKKPQRGLETDRAEKIQDPDPEN